MKFHLFMEAIQIAICAAFSVFMLSMSGQVEGLGKLPIVFLSIGTVFLTMSACLAIVIVKRAFNAVRPEEAEFDPLFVPPTNIGDAR